MSNLARADQSVATAAPVDSGSAMLSMIERAARDQSVDIDKLERLMLMKERNDAKEARAQFDAAMAEMQPKLPAIAERGNAAGRYTYALWEDINTAIKPVLMSYGFALSFRSSFESGVTVTGVLSHRSGHREETSITLPADPSGNKNAVQAVASSVSYGKRYTAGLLLNLTSYGEDDDAYSAGKKLDNKALDWIDVGNGLSSIDEYQTKKAELVASYGSTEKIPKDVVGCFNKAFSRLKAGPK